MGFGGGGQERLPGQMSLTSPEQALAQAMTDKTSPDGAATLESRAEAAISASALVIIKIRVLEGPSLLTKCRMLVPPLQRLTNSGPG